MSSNDNQSPKYVPYLPSLLCIRILTTRPVHSKTTGQLHSLKGTAVEGIGNATGWTDWQTSGRDEHARGEAEYRAAQAQGYAEGARDRLGGRKDAVVGVLAGDREREAAGEYRAWSGFVMGRSADEGCFGLGNVRRDKGQVQQDVNRPE